MKKASFSDDQYVITNNRNLSRSFRKINEIIDFNQSNINAFEKVFIGENHIQGTIKKINHKSFKKINNHFLDEFKDVFEEMTGLNRLELVAVRKNILKKGEMISMHKDTYGYVVGIHLSNKKNYGKKSGTNKGGEILFKKDNDEVVRIKLKSNEILIMKCTNEHGVAKIISGERQSIALFSQPAAALNK